MSAVIIPMLLLSIYGCTGKDKDVPALRPRKAITVSVGETPIVTESERDTLLSIARRSIWNVLNPGKKAVALPVTGGVLNERRGCMVKLTVDSTIRGATGYLLPIRPLAEGVAAMAKQAATGNGRFSGLKPEELDSMIIELTVVSEPATIAEESEIRPGIHGLVIEQQYNVGGIFMPAEVAHFPDAKTAVDTLLARSGTTREEWSRNEVDIRAFTVEVFREQKVRPSETADRK